MKANEVSKLTERPISTLRFYERKQLIPEQFITRDDNNYRVYKAGVVEYLQDVRMLLTLGFTVQELTVLISESSATEKKALVTGKIKYIEELEAKLEASKAFLKDVMEGKAKFQAQCKSNSSF
ncbi:MerR family transcriptional regulator [Paenibacillus sp. MMS18-CY102]|uniref:MerR family transcriptional regulator n=1 Tax=Paenibacillus sp. MMS18-CY102 TaxID=2682849 RepID=UPI0013667195|nr:MerR family transcriptional regulator [Paenibacillus sp. MMS18-CY102]MWC29153.1 MerR family DNA-binding transcriptional regulator [Paenibacillus sp. MMS18-CY102]